MFLSAFAVASRLRAVCSSPLLRKRGTETTVQPGSMGIGDDDTMTILDTGSNVRVSHDGGVTFTVVNLGGLSPASVSHTAGMNTFILAGGSVFHLNAIVPSATTTITGSCGSKSLRRKGLESL